MYYWEKNFPQSPTVFSLRSNQFKYTTYYGLWDTDEFFDLQADPMERNNLIRAPEHQSRIRVMENRLYQMMSDLGGMEIPINQPSRGSQNKRLRVRNGDRAADFPDDFVVDEPLNDGAR